MTDTDSSTAPEPYLILENRGDLEQCRFPKPDGPEWEAEAHRANQLAAAHSRRRLGDLATAVDIAIELPWGADPVVVDTSELSGECERLTTLFDEELGFHDLPAARIRAQGPSGNDALDDIGLKSRGYGLSRPDTYKVSRLAADGGGIALLAIEEQDPALNRWAEDIDRILGQSCQIDLVLAGCGVGLHQMADDGARVVFPVDGAALIELQAANLRGGESPLGPLPTSRLLAPGEGLVISPGWGRRIRGADRPTLVASVLLPRPLLGDVAVKAAMELVFWPAMRADVAVDINGPTASYAGTVFESAVGLGSQVADMVDERMLNDLSARVRASVGARWTSGLQPGLESLAAERLAKVNIRHPLPGGIMAGPDPADGTVVLLAAGRRYRCEPPVARAVARLSDGEVHSFADLAAALPWIEDHVALAVDLVRVGLAEVTA